MPKLKGYERMGRFGVDSGQVLIVDPCYIKDFVDDEYNDEVVSRKTKDNSFDFSYSGACAATLSKKGGGELKNEIGAELAVASQTGFGDGTYEVWVKRSKNKISMGRISELRVFFLQ